jgi:hypothetical protein
VLGLGFSGHHCPSATSACEHLVLVGATNRHQGHLAVKELQLRASGASPKAACKKEPFDSCTPTQLESQVIEDSPDLLPVRVRLKEFADRHCSLRAPKGRHYNLPSHYRTSLTDFEVRDRVACTFAEVSSQDIERVERLAAAVMPSASVQSAIVCPEGSPKRLKSDAAAAELAAGDLPPLPSAAAGPPVAPPCRRLVHVVSDLGFIEHSHYEQWQA